MNTKSLVVILAFVIVAKFVYEDSRYSIGDNEQVVLVYRSGEPSKVFHSEPGEYYKLPFVQEKVYFGKQINSQDIEQQFLTKDYKVVSFESTAHWKISDPVLFYRKLKSVPLAKKFIKDQITDVERTVFPEYSLDDLTVEANLSEYKKAKCIDGVMDKVQDRAKSKLEEVGLELTGINISLSYPIVDNVVGQP